MRKWLDWVLTIVGVILILVAIYLFAKPHIDNYLQNKENEDKIENYDKESNASKQSSEEKSHEKKKLEIPKDKSKMAGYISIPAADIKEPVYPGPATPEQLDRGVSFAEEDESMQDQNVAIAGHTFTDSDDYQFSNLPAAKKGSKVNLTIGDEKRTYKITKIFDVKPDDVKVLDEQDSDKQQLTLITCDDFNPETGMWDTRKIFVAEEVAS